MTEQELKNKIVEILRYHRDDFIEENYRRDIERIDFYALADALIAAEIGDVSEWKHRAEVAERALQKFAENITCEDCPFSSDCASSEKMEDLIHSNYCFAEYLKQAEKELAEERKDDNK